MLTSTDQLGNTINLPAYPKRIISVVPSQTEFLFDIGLENEIVGITRFCIHPKEKVEAIEKIGGTKKFNIEKIKALKPDLIIGNKEENYEEGITELQKHFPVWMSDIYNVEDACEMMKEVSKLVNREVEGLRLTENIKLGLASVKPRGDEVKSAAYFIWRKPYMVAGADTFIDSMLTLFGVNNAFAEMSRYPEISAEQLSAAKPDYIFLSSEPYAFSEKHYDEFREMSPTSKVIVVDGEMFSWYGSRLQQAPAYFEQLCSILR